MSDYRHLKQVLRILKVSSQIQKLDIRIKKFEGNEVKKQQLELQKAQYLAEIEKRRAKYY